MADKGPGPAPLILKRITVEISRLSHSIQQQELQLMELQDQQARIQSNIAASQAALAEAQHNLDVTREQYKQES